MFTTVDSYLERLSGGQIRRPAAGEKECMQCRAVGTLVFGAASVHCGLESFRSRPRSWNRFFFGAVAGCFITAAVWRAVTPTADVHHHSAPLPPVAELASAPPCTSALAAKPSADFIAGSASDKK
eukprot:TRINITY_DN55293_c0_g1_i1.p1 TRINITY_DN55293_c0_g1~~TRINITY_DN55293_c0_g1_i1.p1  ORF type:complete len:125 (+),score=16.19 TRINITY_DN55293_c0_g1_i1:170-544(+)